MATERASLGRRLRWASPGSESARTRSGGLSGRSKTSQLPRLRMSEPQLVEHFFRHEFGRLVRRADPVARRGAALRLAGREKWVYNGYTTKEVGPWRRIIPLPRTRKAA